jgi:formylglycine-generating enzyme required for sulfatase activity
MSDSAAFKYRAFISYSHADTSWAKWLHRCVESFHIDKDLVGRETATGAIPKALRPIFRDRDDFTAGQTLSEQTLAALDASHALIVICSPASAKSHYVNEEIRLFKWRHPERLVIPLIVAGKPGDPELECFPPALKFKLDAKGRITKKRVELLAADAREESDGKNLALAKMVAGLLGVSSDEIFRRAERERRAAMRRKRRVQAAVGMLVLLLAAAGVGWLNQDYLREQYHWRAVMGPALLTANQERVLEPGDEFSECTSLCPTMLMVPAGSFMMGSPEDLGDDTERPQHEVTISKPFAAGGYEVTFAQWDACVAAGACPRAPDSGWGRGDRPVINVSWDDAQQYTVWLARLTGKDYRLLSEAEWEYAARAGTTTAYSWGDEIGNPNADRLDDGTTTAASLRDKTGRGNANCGECGSQWDDKQTAPVGSFEPNGFGLHDMHGNAWEWVEDRSHEDYQGAPTDVSAWVEGGSTSRRVLRGGGWNSFPEDLRSANRVGGASGERNSSGGFRVARTLGP